MTETLLHIDPLILEAIENLPIGLSIYDAEGRPVLYNQLSRQRFRYSFEAFENGARNLAEAQRYSIRKSRPDASEEEIDKIAAQIDEYGRTGKTYEIRSPEGSVLQITFRPLSNDRKVAISVDVTELKTAQAQALAASNAKSAFLANMSHEIRTPLNGILGMAQVLEMGALNQDQRDQVATILDSGRNLMALLNDVLDLSKIEAGKIAIVPADADLVDTLRRLYRLWKVQAEEKGLELLLAFDAELPRALNFDAGRVQQCISNLVSNAIKFTAKGHVEIFVSANALEDGAHLVEIRVADTGPGMEEKTLARLFQPFTQADDLISRDYGGTGLGLSITRKLAELMGGTATAESQVGCGSTFSVSFRGEPALVQTEARSNDKPAPSADFRESLKRNNLRLLLVDDHPINRQVASLFLRPFNMRIVEAANGKEALACLAAEDFDLVLLDIHMPVMDGAETIRAIRDSNEAFAAVPVIALTADAMSGDKERYLSIGMDGYLTKPLAERDLISEISRVRSLTPEQLIQIRTVRSIVAPESKSEVA